MNAISSHLRILSLLVLSCGALAVQAAETTEAPKPVPSLEALPPSPQKEKVVAIQPKETAKVREKEELDDVLLESVDDVNPSREPYLAAEFPDAPEYLKPFISTYPLKEMGYANLESFTFEPDAGQAAEYKRILTAMKVARSDSYAKERAYLVSDLLMATARSEKYAELKEAYDSYANAIEQYPDPRYAIPASYHMGLLLLEMKDYRAAARLASKQTEMWAKDLSWVSLFRSVIMESFYRNKRYMRAEDYLWELASHINREELTGYLVRRYGDSLYRQRKFKEVVEWYKDGLIHNFLDDSTPAAVLSRLFYADSLFATGDIASAQTQYELFKKAYTGDLSEGWMDYRLAECRLLLTHDTRQALQDFYSMSMKSSNGLVKALSKIAWARLVAKGEDPVQYVNAHATIKNMLDSQLAPDAVRDALIVKGLLEWRLGQRETGIKTLGVLIPEFYIPDFAHDPVKKAASDLSVLLLTKEAPGYWQRGDTMGFLVQADRLSPALEMSSYKTELLYWVGQAYLSNGMATAAAHTFEKILMDTPERRKSRLLIEMARVYGQTGDIKLMGKALELIYKTPEDPQERQAYYLMKATYALAINDLIDALNQWDLLMQKGVMGEDVFKYALEGARIARKAKNFDKALKFIGLLGLEDGKIPDNSVPVTIRDIQIRAYFEKVNLLAVMGKTAESIELFSKLESQGAGVTPPLETVFIMVDAYRQAHEPDRASEVWKTYGSEDATLPQGFKDQYSKLLEMLGEVELVPVTPDKVNL